MLSASILRCGRLPKQLALIAPRFAIVLVWLFSDYLGRAYETVIWPLLGFF